MFGLLALVPLCAPLGADPEVINPIQYYIPVNSFDLDEIGYPGTQGRVVHGDPSGDLVGAMFFLVDGEVLWSPMPYSLTSVAPLAPTQPTAFDLALVPSSQGDRDLLVISTSLGLMAAIHDPPTSTFQVTALAASGPWQGSTQLKRRQIGVAQTTVLSGLRADGQTVQVSAVDESGVTDLFSVSIPLPVMEHDLIDFDGDGKADVAVVTSFGLFIFNQSGALLRREQVDTQAGGVVTFESQGSERLAFWFQDPTSGLAFLRVVDGPVTEAEVPLSVLAPGGLNPIDVLPSFAVRGDYNADANQDLLLQIHHQFCVLLLNQAPDAGPPPAAHFGTLVGEYHSIALGGNPSATTDPGQAWAYFGNIDSDPGDDLIVPLDAANRIEIHTRAGELSPGESLVGFTSADLVASETTYWWNPTLMEARLNLALDVPVEYLPGAPGGFEYLQVLTWFQNGTDGQLLLLGEQNSLHALTSDAHQWIAVQPLETQTLLTGDHWPEQDNIWVVFRFVDADVVQLPPRIERASRFMIGAFTLRTTSGGTSIPPYLPNLGGKELSLYLSPAPYPSEGGPEQSFNGGKGPKSFHGNGKKTSTGLPAAGPGQLFGSGGNTLPQGNGYVGGYVPQSSSVLFPPGDVPILPSPIHGGGMGNF